MPIFLSGKGRLLIVTLLLDVFVSYTSAIKPVLPEICGTQWQLDYAKLHENALQGKSTENKYIINVPVRSGSADVLLGFMSMFLWSLLTDRVFIKYQSSLLPMIELAFEPATFNWLAPHNPIESHIQCLHTIEAVKLTNSTDRSCDKSPLKVLKSDSKPRRPHALNVLGFDESFWHDDMRKYPKDSFESEVMFALSAKGFMYQMFHNPHHNETLKSWGLKPQTIFGCIYHYLLRPKDIVCKSDVDGCVKAEAAIVKAKAQPNTVLISVQLRNGDSGMEFQCARKLEKQYNARNITVYYVLMTSSSHLQNHYKSLYGDKLILPSWTPLTIVDFHHAGDFTNKFSTEKKVRANRDLARDIYINSLADVHIIAYSGLGSMTASLRPRDDIRIYRVNTNNASDIRPCHIDEPDSLDSVSTQHSGL